ncbi:MAG: RICIN domain-containing protein [Sporocytophaga sp.]|nr:RICIN domain-containing protein [Sporocytophaga sp.]
MTRLIFTFIFTLFLQSILSNNAALAQMNSVVPGGDWRDTNGNLISATEGGIINVDGVYYLWGMDRSKSNYTFEGINLYSSPDLKNWTFVNQILKKTSHAELNNGAVVERAKLLHNKKTGQFIIWMHYEGYNAYSVAEVGYATCNTIGGNYTFRSHFRPMNIDSRDINVYQDTDGKAYLICTTKGNQNVSLFELDENYTGIVKEVYRGSASNDMECEGHAIIKTGGYYFWLMSWCTGWDFNDNRFFYSRTLAGPWTSGGNIAVTNTHTYESQVGFAVPVVGKETTTFLYMGDRWSVNNFAMSRIVLLPITVSGTKLSVGWNDQYNIDTKTGVWAPGAANFQNGVYKITAKHSGKVLDTNGSSVQQQNYTGSSSQHWRIQNLGASFFRITNIESGKVIDINGASRDAGAKAIQYNWNDAYNQKWQIIDCGDGYHRLVSVNTLGKALQISGASDAAGANAELGVFNYSNNQLWEISAVSDKIQSGNTYRIVNRTSNKVLDGIADQVVQNSAGNSGSQIWEVTDLRNGYYSIANSLDGKLLSNDHSVTNLDPIVLSDSEDISFAEEWQITDMGNGYFSITNRMSGKVLDNKDGELTDGNPVVQYSDYSSNNNNQQWSLQAADIITSVSDFSVSSQIKVYPNPARERIHVSLGNLNASKISLVDLCGKEIVTVSGMLQGDQHIETGKVGNGIYVIVVEGDEFRISSGIVIE